MANNLMAAENVVWHHKNGKIRKVISKGAKNSQLLLALVNRRLGFFQKRANV